MDDFNVSALHESKNEWGARLLTILTPLIVEGFKSIFEESLNLCRANNEMDKYLMTFQNFISRIPKWNPTIIENEKKRICDKSGCTYLDDLITCVHIIQLKLLTAVRAGTKQKKVDIQIPKFEDFIHKVYIHVARKIYKNVYLFEANLPPLQTQKNHRELEVIIQECILNAVRESIPIDMILRAYLDETIEDDVVEEIKETPMPDETLADSISSAPISQPMAQPATPSMSSKLSFNNVDMAIGMDNKEEQISAPKDIARLEEISNIRNEQRKLETDDDDDDADSSGGKIQIFNENVNLGQLDVHDIEPQRLEIIPDLLIDDIEVLG
jgi:hypothetical protein